MKLLKIVTVTILASGVLLGSAFYAQAQISEQLISASRVARADDQMTGAVYVTIGGRELQIADSGIDAWVLDAPGQLKHYALGSCCRTENIRQEGIG